MERPVVLMAAPITMPAETARKLEETAELLRLWEAPDAGAFLARHGERIRGFAASGSFRSDRAFFEQVPRLEILANFGVGYDGVDTAEAARRGVVVTNTPDVLTEEVADIAIGLLIATLRQIPQSDRYLREGRWLEKPFPLSRGTLRERRVGILGLGRIGRAIARRIEAFGLPVAYHGRTKQDAPYRYYGDLVEMARDVDTLIVVTPGGEGTRKLVNAQVLEALGPTGVLVNVARGTVVDERALIEALRAGTILSAGLDVFEDEPRVPEELIAMEHVVLLPHIGSASVHTRDEMGRLVAENLIAWFREGRPLTPVAETPWPRS